MQPKVVLVVLLALTYLDLVYFSVLWGLSVSVHIDTAR